MRRQRRAVSDCGGMDWKRFYGEQLARPDGRKAALDAVEHHAGGDPVIQQALLAGGCATFPHVTLRDSAAPIARVVQSILECGKPRVMALGVLHGGTLPMHHREAWAALNNASISAEEVFPRFAGAFVERGVTPTPFGPIADAAVPAGAEFIREDPSLLSGEFSLDLFLALLAAAAQVRGVRPPAVTRLYVSATRSPDGRFHVAQALAQEIRRLIDDDDTVCVATGDLAHIGHGYSTAAEVAALTSDVHALEAMLLPQLQAMNDAAVARRDFATAWAIGTRCRSDQRHLLPVIADLVGPRAAFDLLSFRLSDYAAINGMPPPCCVAAALGVFRPQGIIHGST